jgi:nitrogen-specific signal transduction histidine kinase
MRKTHKIIDINPQASLLVGLPSDKLIGNLCHKFICPNRINNCPITDLNQSIESSETSLLTHTGEAIPILKTALRLELDGRDCLLESFVDISDQKKAEELKMERSKIEAVLETAGAVCHEFNQPLMVISGFAELLLKELHDPGKVAKYANTIIRQIERMGDITRKMMSITRYSTKKYLDSKILDLDNSQES